MKITCFVPPKDNAISFYRGYGVMSELHRTDPMVQCLFPDQFDVREIKGTNIAFFVRPDTPELIAILMACKQLKMKIVVDIDDDLTSVPWHNKYNIVHLLNDVDYKKNIQIALENAHAVIVSTESLKFAYSKFNKNIHVVRNAVDNYCYDAVKERNISNTVLWRGSKFHKQDLNFYKAELLAAITSNPDFDFLFMGDIFPKWLNGHKNVKYVRPVGIYEYPLRMRELQPALTIIPLAYQGQQSYAFNLGKSDIAKMEATVAGSLCVAPAWPEWTWDKDDFYYSDKSGFLSQVNSALNLIRVNDKSLNDIWARNLNYIMANRLLSQTNRQRLTIMG